MSKRSRLRSPTQSFVVLHVNDEAEEVLVAVVDGGFMAAIKLHTDAGDGPFTLRQQL